MLLPAVEVVAADVAAEQLDFGLFHSVGVAEAAADNATFH